MTSQAPDSGDSDNTPRESGRNALSLNLNFLKNLKEKKLSKDDGQPVKKRGPKPDSKPALTRRQELNRHAQRTHRERKEMYIRSLEQEVLRLKESFSKISRDKDAIEEENQRLKALLAQYDIPWTEMGVFEKYTRNNSNSYVTARSNSGSYAPQSPVNSPVTSQYLSISPPESGSNQNLIDFEQAGIDFVLTLERPCMDHMPFLIERASKSGSEPCGHALMASCPPDPYVDSYPDSPFRNYHSSNTNDSQKTWDINKSDLANLLDLSKKLNLNGEITPVMAWGMIISHPKIHRMRLEDINFICQTLTEKIKCYGFGAVLEEFEVQDAIKNIFFDDC